MYASSASAMRFFGIESFARIIENSKNPAIGGASTYLVSPVSGWTRSSTTPRSQSASRRGLSAWEARLRRLAIPSSPVGMTGSREARSASSGLYRVARRRERGLGSLQAAHERAVLLLKMAEVPHPNLPSDR